MDGVDIIGRLIAGESARCLVRRIGEARGISSELIDRDIERSGPILDGLDSLGRELRADLNQFAHELDKIMR